MRLYRSTANFTKVEKIAIQCIAVSGLSYNRPQLFQRSPLACPHYPYENAEEPLAPSRRHI